MSKADTIEPDYKEPEKVTGPVEGIDATARASAAAASTLAVQVMNGDKAEYTAEEIGPMPTPDGPTPRGVNWADIIPEGLPPAPPEM